METTVSLFTDHDEGLKVWGNDFSCFCPPQKKITECYDAVSL